MTVVQRGWDGAPKSWRGDFVQLCRRGAQAMPKASSSTDDGKDAKINRQVDGSQPNLA